MLRFMNQISSLALWGRRVVVSCVVMVGACVFASPGQATPVYDYLPYQTTAFTVNTTGDLILNQLPTAISGTQDQESVGSDTTGAALTNGAFGPANPYDSGGPGSSPSMTIINTNASITYELSSLSTISEIDSYSAWQDGGRSQQSYNVSVSADGINYMQIASVNNPNADPYPNGESPSDSMVTITDTTGTLASGVKFIQFNFPTVENTYVGYTEFAVLSPVPEPSTFVMLGLGAAGLILAARRRKT